jgi:flavin reductase (DIM6/NTAB) family NADH-FMN oxidoreductase RutF
VGWCPAKTSASWPAIQASGSFCVNVLAEDQEEICRRFATKDPDMFTGLAWQPCASSSPRLHDVLAWIDCDIEAVHDAGDHELCLGRVRDIDVARESGPLVFASSGTTASDRISLSN